MVIEVTEAKKDRLGTQDFSSKELERLRNLSTEELKDYYNSIADDLDTNAFPSFGVFLHWVKKLSQYK